MKKTMKQKNLLYTMSFDGAIFYYEASRVLSVLFRLLGMNRHLEIPIHIVLTCRNEKSILGFVKMSLTVDRYRFGSTKLNPRKLRPILLFGKASGFIEQVVDEIKKQSKGNRNVSLSHLSQAVLGRYYANEELTQNSETSVGDLSGLKSEFSSELQSVYPLE